jgi:hypothetical protein
MKADWHLWISRVTIAGNIREQEEQSRLLPGVMKGDSGSTFFSGSLTAPTSSSLAGFRAVCYPWRYPLEIEMVSEF